MKRKRDSEKTVTKRWWVGWQRRERTTLRGHQQALHRRAKGCSPMLLGLMFNHIFHEHTAKSNLKILQRTSDFESIFFFLPFMFGSRDYATQILLRCRRCLPRGEATAVSSLEQVKQKINKLWCNYACTFIWNHNHTQDHNVKKKCNHFFFCCLQCILRLEM